MEKLLFRQTGSDPSGHLTIWWVTQTDNVSVPFPCLALHIKIACCALHPGPCRELTRLPKKVDLVRRVGRLLLAELEFKHCNAVSERLVFCCSHRIQVSWTKVLAVAIHSSAFHMDIFLVKVWLCDNEIMHSTWGLICIGPKLQQFVSSQHLPC